MRRKSSFLWISLGTAGPAWPPAVVGGPCSVGPTSLGDEHDARPATTTMASNPATARRRIPVVSQTVLPSPTRSVALAVALAAAACGARERASTGPTTTAPTGSPAVTVPLPSTTTTEATTTTTEAPTTITTDTPTTTTPVPGPPARVVRRGNTGGRTIALTFDAGADLGWTSRILDVLDEHGVKATFGIAGRWAEQHPELVRRMAGAGHLVMNHSYAHRSYTGVSAKPALLSFAERRADIERTEEVLRNLTGTTPRPWFRSPYGDYDASVNAALGALGYRFNVLWTVDSLGWQGLSPAAITARCLQGAAPGAILLFHVGAQSQDVAALPSILAGLRQGGYGFGTVAEVVL